MIRKPEVSLVIAQAFYFVAKLSFLTSSTIISHVFEHLACINMIKLMDERVQP